MKKFRELSEAIKDKYDIGEYDQEGDMAKSDLRSIIANSKRVHDMLKDDDNLPEWVQSKITKAEDYMSTVANYLESEMNEAVKMPKQTRAEKEYRKITGKTVDQRMSELDKVQKDLAKQREDYIKQGIIKAEEVEQIDEGIGGTIAGGIGQFIGNKIDPLHGEIMRAHGEVAGRAAEYTIRKHLNKLHTALKKHLSSGAVSEEVELDEVSADVAKRVARERDRSAVANKLTPTQSRRLKMGDKGGDPDMNAGKALKSAMKRGAKNVYDEEVELDEGKYGAFRTGPKRPKYPYVPQGDKDPRTGLPLGFSEPKKVKEEVEHLEEKNVPTSPEKWARAKAQAKAKFDVYPSAYANGWAAKKYKEMGGGWKSVSEETDLDEGYFKRQETERQETERLAKKDDLPFTPDKPKKRSVVVGKKPEGYSRVRQLARQAIPKPVREAKEMSKKAKIVKDAMKKSPDDTFQAKPELSDSVTRNL